MQCAMDASVEGPDLLMAIIYHVVIHDAQLGKPFRRAPCQPHHHMSTFMKELQRSRQVYSHHKLAADCVLILNRRKALYSARSLQSLTVRRHHACSSGLCPKLPALDLAQGSPP